jgi:transposase-like protein
MTKELNKIYKKFPNQDKCLAILELVWWNNEPKCPYCGSTYQSPLKSEHRRYHCNNCNCSYSVTVHSIFHKTKCDLQKWFYAVEILFSNQKITARGLASEINVTKDTALRMMAQIKKDAKKTDSPINKLSKQLIG